MLREAILAFLGVKASGPEGPLARRDEKNIQSKYCIACKKAKKDNCETCTRNFKIIH